MTEKKIKSESIENPSLHEVTELKVLYEISQALSSSLDLEKVMTDVMDVLHDKMGMERGTLTLKSVSENELVIKVAPSLKRAEIDLGRYRVGEGIIGKVVEAGEPIVVPNVGDEPLFLNRTQSRGDLSRKNIAYICVPIKLKNETIGALSVDRLFEGNVSLEEDLRLLTVISSMLAHTVQNYRIRQNEKEKLQKENKLLRQELRKKFHPSNIIGESKRMSDVYASIDLVSQSRASVMLRGESGTGKELVAHAIHYNSDRSGQPFVKVSCAALPETLLESEFFGYEKGAFTGATASKIGRFEMANQGTLFLDEIGDISPATQVKLLRVLQEREFVRLGGIKTIHVDIRLVAATNRDLEADVKEGKFREDLYYRLNVIPIFLPALRERKEDIPLLVEHFLTQSAKINKKDVCYVSDEAMDYLLHYAWPGNVRELENAIERAVVLCTGDTVNPDLFPIPGSKLSPVHMHPSKQTHSSAQAEMMDERFLSGTLPEAVEVLERMMLKRVLDEVGGNQRKAAKALGVTERILGYKLKSYKMR